MLPKANELRQVLWVGLASVIAYGTYWAAFAYGISDQVLFSGVDAREYRAVGEWILHGTGTDRTLTRPYLYPLLVGLSYGVGGAFGTWALQAFAWLIAVQAVFLAAWRATGTVRIAWFASAVVVANISLFALTFHALTEPVTTAVLAVLVLFVVSYREEWRSVRYFIAVVFLLVVLALLRPVFMPLLIAWLVVVGPVFHWRNFMKRPAPVLLLLLALSPLLPQLIIMQQRHAHIGISRIGESTFRNYLFARGYGALHELELEEAQVAVREMSGREMRAVVLASPSTFAGLFATHLEDNLYYAGGYTLELAPGHLHPAGTWIMDRMNKSYSILHGVMLLPCIVLLFRLYRRGDHSSLWPMLILLLVTLLILLSSGISFWQGDRLTLPSIVVWPLLYAWTMQQFLRPRTMPS